MPWAGLLLALAQLAAAPLAVAQRAPTGPPAAEDSERPAVPLEEGEVAFDVTPQEPQVARRFQLQPHRFRYALKPLGQVSQRVVAAEVTFPSPVETPEVCNNTVHCEYYRPEAPGRHPGVVVLHILGGDFPLARLFCHSLAQNGVAALFVKMPYYGPRRDPNSNRRMVDLDPRRTVQGMTQAVLDIRRATAWLAARGEIDAEQLGIFGISLGGITGALAAGAEPRLRNVCLLLAGGDIGKIAWESPEAAKARRAWLAQGGTKQEFYDTVRVIDPVQYAANVRGRRILMINATDDEVVPRACTDSLWRAFGEPPIEWYSGGHYSVARHLLKVVLRVPKFFQPQSP